MVEYDVTPTGQGSNCVYSKDCVFYKYGIYCNCCTFYYDWDDICIDDEEEYEY